GRGGVGAADLPQPCPHRRWSARGPATVGSPVQKAEASLRADLHLRAGAADSGQRGDQAAARSGRAAPGDVADSVDRGQARIERQSIRAFLRNRAQGADSGGGSGSGPQRTVRAGNLGRAGPRAQSLAPAGSGEKRRGRCIWSKGCSMTQRLGVNVDHVATLRQARKASYPDPIAAAAIAEIAGGEQITLHLREDRRHIQERDVRILRSSCQTALNLEMAATQEMVKLAYEFKPDTSTLVPERREELTTEGGLDVNAQLDALK